MRILHTSDWHLGRTFHRHSVLENLKTVLAEIATLVSEEGIDVVVVSGDVYDHSMPAAELYGVLDATVAAIRDNGAEVVMISGNHDSAQRLGAGAQWTRFGGVHLLTKPDAFRFPVTISDEHGEVDFYGIPYLEPMLIGDLFETDGGSGADTSGRQRPKTQQQVIARAMAEVNALVEKRKHRSVVLSHCFAVNISGRQDSAGDNGAAEAAELNTHLQRDITAGGVDVVAAEVFQGVDYAALGHIHSRQTLLENVRYCGAPLHFSFGEANRPRGVWIVELNAAGLKNVTWRDLSIPRPLSRVTASLEALLEGAEYEKYERHWLEVELTDTVQPIDAMRRVQERFPFCAQLRFPRLATAERSTQSYRERISDKAPIDIVDEFLKDVRNPEGASAAERELLESVIRVSMNADTRAAAPGTAAAGTTATNSGASQ